jgi:ribose transport system permease protein
VSASAPVERPAPPPAPADGRAWGALRALWKTREVSTLLVLGLEVAFFTWYLWPEGDRAHPFFNFNNAVLVFKYSSLYGIAAIGAAMVIISGGVDLAPGAVMAVSGVVTGSLFVQSGQPLGVAVAGGLVMGLLAGALSAVLVTAVRLPPFIATLGVMGIARGAAFIITEGRYFDLSSRIPAGWQPFGIPADWLAPIILLLLAVVFQTLMTGFQWGRAVFAIGGNETAALFSGIRVGRVKASVYVIAAFLASLSGIILVTVQGQGRADLATGYELDIIASSVVGGASLSGGRGSVVGAVLGTLIFGVLRNALPQIPGATFYDRLIVGVVVVVIVVVDQFIVRKGG